MVTLDELLEAGGRLNMHVESCFLYCAKCKKYEYHDAVQVPEYPFDREYRICRSCQTAKGDLPIYG